MHNTLQTSGQSTFVFYALVATGVLLTAGQAQAQTIYRVVGADGKVTFSDQPPAASAKATTTTAAGASIGGGAGAALPFALRQVVSQYPVTLYSADNCVPCNAGRELLSTRGIPFTEKTINSAEDTQALQRISGESSLPLLTIGSQQIKGYSVSEWTQFLNAAGYPQTSILPARYRNPAATPLVTVQKALTPTQTEAAQVPPAPAQSSAQTLEPSPNNPAGIRF